MLIDFQRLAVAAAGMSAASARTTAAVHKFSDAYRVIKDRMVADMTPAERELYNGFIADDMPHFTAFAKARRLARQIK